MSRELQFSGKKFLAARHAIMKRGYSTPCWTYFFSSGCRSWKLRLYFDYGSRLLSMIQAAGSGIIVWAIFTLSLYMRSGLHSFIWRVKHGFILYLYILPLFVTKQCSSLLLYKSVIVSLCLIKFNVNKLTQIFTGSVNFKGQFQGCI